MVKGLGEDDIGRRVEQLRVDGRGGLFVGIKQRVLAKDRHQFVGLDGGGNLDGLHGFLELVDFALEVLEPGAADGEFGRLDDPFLVLAEDGQAKECVQVLQCLPFMGVRRVLNGLTGQGGGDGQFLEAGERGVDVVMVFRVERDGFFLRVGSTELLGGFEDGHFFQRAVRLDAVESVAPVAADEGDGTAGTAGIGATDTGAEREFLDAAELVGVLLPEATEFHEQLEAFVAFLVLGGAFKQAKVLDFLGLGVNLAVLAERGVECLQLHDRLLLQLDVVVHFGGRVEVVDVDARGECANAVDAPDALHEPGGVPRRVVVHDDIRPVEVDAFGKDFRGEQDVELIGLLDCRYVGVKVGADIGHPFLPCMGINGQDAVIPGFGEPFVKVLCGVLGFGEDDKPVAVVDLAAEQVGFQMFEENVELRVFFDRVPFGAESDELLMVSAQPVHETSLEVGRGADGDGGIGGLAFFDLGDEFGLAVFDEELGDVEVGSDVDRALRKHIEHDLRCVTEPVEGLPESVEAAVEPFHQQRPHDVGELQRDAVGVLILAFLVLFQELDGPVTVVSQGVGIRAGEQEHRAVVQVFQCRGQGVIDGAGFLDLRENNALFDQVLLVLVVFEEVFASTADGNLGNDFGADARVDFFDLPAGLFDFGLALGFTVFQFPLSEEVAQVGDVEGAIAEVLEHRNLVREVAGLVVQRRGADKDDFLSRGRAVRAFHRRLAEALEAVECLGGVVAELVRLVHDDQIEFLRVSDLMDAAVGDDLDVIEAELVFRPFPVVLQCRWDDDQGVGTVAGEAVVKVELLGDEHGDDGLAQPDHVREEEAIVLFQQPVTAVDRVNLVGQPLETVRQVGDSVRIVLDVHAEILGE